MFQGGNDFTVGQAEWNCEGLVDWNLLEMTVIELNNQLVFIFEMI